MVTRKEIAAMFLVGLLLVTAVWLFKPAYALDPTGASVNDIRTETAPNDSAGSDNAEAGNISELTVFAYTTTQTWQGYIGNVSGTIQLADADDDVLYNWSLADPEGEIYASVNESITWRQIQCFNYSATGEIDDTGETPGAVNAKGRNLSQLEADYGIIWDDVDGVNETFYLYDPASGAGGGAGQHDEFFTSNLQFSEGECVSTRVFGDSGEGVSNEFEEVILYEPTTDSVVFVALIEEDLADAIDGYDGNDYDFEMLVLEDGHGTDTDVTTYYFFVELE